MDVELLKVAFKGDTDKEREESDIEERLRLAVTTFKDGQQERLETILNENAKTILTSREDGRAAIHQLCDAFSEFSKKTGTAAYEEASQICSEMVQILLEHGAIVDSPDNVGATGVHHAAKSIKFPLEAFKSIVAKSDNINTLDCHGDNALHVALQMEPCFLSSERVEVLLDSGCSLTCKNRSMMTALDVLLNSLKKTERESFLATSHRSSFGRVVDTIVKTNPTVVENYKHDLLWPAVLGGSISTVKFLLDRQAEPSKSYRLVNEFPLVLAAGLSAKDPDDKFDLLLEKGYDPHVRGAKGGNVSHAAAQQGNLGILQRVKKLEINWKLLDSTGATVLHKAARGGTKASDALDYLIQEGFDAEAKNAMGQTPLYMALVAKNEKGCASLLSVTSSVRLSTEQLAELHFEQLQLLSNPDPIFNCRDPLLVSLQLSHAFKKASRMVGAYELDMITISDSLEDLAVDMIQSVTARSARNVLSVDLLSFAIKAEKKRFMASAIVQDYVGEIWQGSMHTGKAKSTTETIKDITLSMLIVIFLPCFAEELDFLSKNPMIAFTANFLSYTSFIGLLIAAVIYNKEVDRTALSTIDWLVLVFVAGFIMQEVVQFIHMRRKGKTTSYFKSMDNMIDSFILLIFVAYYLLLFIGFYVDDVNSFQLVRASYHLFGFASLGCCVRILSYLRIHRVLGPVELSFIGMLQLFFTFLVMLLIFMLGFALAIASIYQAVPDSPGAPANSTAPKHIYGFIASFRTVFWTSLGSVSIDSFEANTEPETIVGSFIFLVWSIVADRILLGLLFGLVFSKFDEIQGNAQMEWKFARSKIVLEYSLCPLMPVPFNVISLPFKPFCCYLAKKAKFQGRRKRRRGFNRSGVNEMVKKYRKQKGKSEKDDAMTKRDLQMVEEDLAFLKEKLEYLWRKKKTRPTKVLSNLLRKKKEPVAEEDDTMPPLDESEESIDEADHDEYASATLERSNTGSVLGKFFGSLKSEDVPDDE
eukprot:m.251954 g.251954  ORF g.251954 m.251954 type:complete len:986 (+) comp40340_c0_seq2:122-3079(+)